MTLVTFENIIVGTFLFVILLGLIGALLAFIKYAILYPLSSYYTKEEQTSCNGKRVKPRLQGKLGLTVVLITI